MFSSDMAEAFHNILKSLHPIPRMEGKFIPMKDDGTYEPPVLQESQFFDMACLNMTHTPYIEKGNAASPLKV